MLLLLGLLLLGLLLLLLHGCRRRRPWRHHRAPAGRWLRCPNQVPEHGARERLLRQGQGLVLVVVVVGLLRMGRPCLVRAPAQQSRGRGRLSSSSSSSERALDFQIVDVVHGLLLVKRKMTMMYKGHARSKHFENSVRAGGRSFIFASRDAPRFRQTAQRADASKKHGEDKKRDASTST